MSFIDGVKDFGKQVLGSAADAVGGAAGASVVDAVLGNDPIGEAENAVQHGAGVDVDTFKRIHKFKYKFGRRKGMTPTELLGNGGGMSGTAGGAATSTLGNQAAASEMQQNQLRMTLGTELAKTRMQTDAQRDIAEMQAGVTRRGQDITQSIEDKKLLFKVREFEEVTLPQAAETLKLTEQQTLKQINDVATSTPEFLRAMKLLTMSAENLLATFLINGQPYDITDPKALAKMSHEERSALLTTMVGVTSHTYREATGIQEKGKDTFRRYLDMLEDRNKRSGVKTSAVPDFDEGLEGIEKLTPGQRRVFKSHAGGYQDLMDQ
jgi:hypothetical protein